MTRDDETRTTETAVDEGSAAHAGMPGDGAGRREDVRGSGVYPMSGPEPSADAPLQPEGSWGQGDEGVRGYQDSGTSEVIPPGARGDAAEETGGSGDRSA